MTDPSSASMSDLVARLDRLPAAALDALEVSRALLHVNGDRPGAVAATTRRTEDGAFDPEGLESLPDDRAEASVLETWRREAGLHAVTTALFRIDDDLVAETVEALPETAIDPAGVRAVLERFRAAHPDAVLAYVATHANRGPAGPLTVFIGGDCYRLDQPSFAAVLMRTRLLAEAMLGKSVSIFPDLPALHGGKKGEWVVLDAAGRSLHELEEPAVAALATVAIPAGIGFLDRLKERQARAEGMLESSEEFGTGMIMPDTGSPDVVSGAWWSHFFDTWAARGMDERALRRFTCAPEAYRGPSVPSSVPTGYGVAAVADELARRFFGSDAPTRRRYLVEALGAVSRSVLEALIDRHGVPRDRIVAFDPHEPAVHAARERFGIEAVHAGHDDFYRHRLADLAGDGGFDVWINNGLGDNTSADHVAALVDAGVRVFCGGANNFLQVAEESASFERIFAAGGIAWPDRVTSGGGWTLAVLDLVRRCRGRSASDPAWRDRILEVIASRNADLIHEVVERTGPIREAGGRAIWDEVNRVLAEREARARETRLAPAEARAAARVEDWPLEAGPVAAPTR